MPASKVSEKPFRGKDLTGKLFTRLRVDALDGFVRSSSRPNQRSPVWKCTCISDGNVVRVISSHKLISGHTRSCGCLVKEVTAKRSTTHGLTRHPLYRVWCGMWKRCTNPHSPGWNNYGGRGIMVCNRWKSFEMFFKDMFPSWKPGLTIDRYPDNNGNYDPSNCRWATRREQRLNCRRIKHVTINGITKPLWQWCKHYGINMNTLEWRLRRGYSHESALTTPIDPSKQRGGLARRTP